MRDIWVDGQGMMDGQKDRWLVSDRFVVTDIWVTDIHIYEDRSNGDLVEVCCSGLPSQI